MKLTHLASAAAAIALMGGAAYAQPAEPAPAPDQQKPADTTAAPPPADTATTPSTTPAPSTEAAPSSAAPSTTPPADTPGPAPTGASTNTATFANLTTTNGPIPDTAENRKKYGKPMSNAGKKSAAKGN